LLAYDRHLQSSMSPKSKKQKKKRRHGTRKA
jgi:hypothetical protein